MLRKNIPHFPIWKSTPIYINDPFMKIDGAGIEFGIRDKVFYMITSRSDITSLRPGDILFLVGSAFSLAASGFFAVLILAVFSKRINQWGAMLVS